MAEFFIVHTTTDSKEEAENLAFLATKERLAACAQIEGPLTSYYWWQDKLEKADEWRCVFKTSAGLLPDLEKMLKKNHSYDVLELVAIPIVKGSNEYLSWLEKETGNHKEEAGNL
jgi:periplasmic divalent cation tolerance protein